MPSEPRQQVTIVDYGLGNLHSVQQACAHAGLRAVISSSARDILTADAVILPGVGAYGDAMRILRERDLIAVIQEVAASPRFLLGICLGMQLLMTESEEFGLHQGLGIIEGRVVKFKQPKKGDQALKVPHIGWNAIHRVPSAAGADPWTRTILAGLADGETMYFVHSYIVQPQNPRVTLSTSTYGEAPFCSALQHGNVFACQFHPERSGPRGLAVYHNLATWLSADNHEERSESIA
jgi:glutamine amidotransferase